MNAVRNRRAEAAAAVLVQSRIVEGAGMEVHPVQVPLGRPPSVAAPRREIAQPPVAGLGALPGRGSPRSHTEQLVRMMVDYIHRHYHRPLALGDIAAELRMNASYLSNLFSKTKGVTFHRYLDALRLARAKELLRDPRTRVCEVACAVGYVSPNHFRNVFKAREGSPPSVWRGFPSNATHAPPDSRP
jgi:AraC-like DNA-binding protein